MLNAVGARGDATRDSVREEDKDEDEVERRLSEGSTSPFRRVRLRCGISSPMRAETAQRECHREPATGGPNGSVMLPAKIIERKIVRPIFLRVDFKGDTD